MTGHTTGDLVAWCPETRCLFAGDVVFNGVTPLAISGSVTAWLRSLDEIEALDARTIVPGHGPVCGPDAVAGMRDYFHWCQRAAEQLVAGTPMQAALADRDPAWVHWPYRERDIPNVLRAAADLTEQPFDFLAALQAMVADMGHLIHAPT